MKLTGEVILDDETLNKLRSELKADLRVRIQERGLYAEEAMAYMNGCDYTVYLSLIKQTINTVVDNTSEDKLRFPSDQAAFKKLQLIKGILDLD